MTDNLSDRNGCTARLTGKVFARLSGNLARMSDTSDLTLRGSIAKRLRALQKVAGATDDQMAEYISISRSAWSNATRAKGKGINKPSEEAMVRLCERTRLTMDWIYRGDYSQVPYELAAALKFELGEIEDVRERPGRVRLLDPVSD